MAGNTLTIDVCATNGVPARMSASGQNIVIGRAKEVGVPLESNTISRRHAEMLRDPFGRWWIRDLGSRNGTHVNGVRVTESVVRYGDLVQLGEFSLTLAPTEETHGATPVPTPGAAAAAVPVVDGDVGRIKSLKEFDIPRLSATHLSTLSEFGQALLSIEEPGKRLTALCKLMVRPEFRGRSAVALRASKENLTEAPKPLCAAESAAENKEGNSPYVSRTLLRTVLARNEAVLASNKGSGPAAGGEFAELSISSEVMAICAVACPIRSESKYSDLLYVVFSPECGTAEWLALASLAVKQFQQAESTWKAKKLGEDHASIERELGRAHEIQERLVPRNIQVTGLDFDIGFTPCRWVGGDYVDVVPGKEGKVLLTVADVCGKGLPAALVASSLHMMTHTAMRSNTPLPDIMRNLNVYLAESLAQGTFVTMLAALLDPAAGTLEVINAGHPAGLFVTPRGEVTLTLAEANMPLGLDGDAELVSQTTSLEKGTFLFLFTDGLTELTLENGELLGDEALGEQIGQLIRSAARMHEC